MTTIHAACFQVLTTPINTTTVSLHVVYNAVQTNKSEETYREFLTAVKNLTNNFIPLTVMTDFEHQLQSFLSNVLPGIFRVGCLFLFTTRQRVCGRAYLALIDWCACGHPT